ncbi:MAG: hypothetical protein HC936_09045 [Leptolyngbyaceae cyanobacterium SU_3_3]|nr:hypothetical protein [Leptolyngbyaceae cyanobacterium SU_3_3]
MSQFSDLSEIQTWLTDKTQKTLTSTPLPERERGFEPNVTFLTSPLPQGEKGLRDEGTRLYQSTRIQTGNLVTSTSRGQLLRSQSPGTLGNRRSVNEPFFEVRFYDRRFSVALGVI